MLVSSAVLCVSVCVCFMLSCLFVYTLNRKVRQGPSVLVERGKKEGFFNAKRPLGDNVILALTGLKYTHASQASYPLIAPLFTLKALCPGMRPPSSHLMMIGSWAMLWP